MKPSAIPSEPSTTLADTWLREVERVRRERPADAWVTAQHGFSAAMRTATPARRGEMWRMRGHVLRGLRRARAAVTSYRRAERWFAQAGETRERGRCAIGLVDALMYLGRHREAAAAATRGRRLLRSVRDNASLARLANNEGNLYHRLDLPGVALERYLDAKRYFGRARDERSAAMVETNIANCLSLLGRLAEARPLYDHAVVALNEHGLPLVSLDASYNRAYLEFLEYRYEIALDAMDQVGRSGTEQGYPSIVALVALDRSEILLRMGAYDDAHTAALDAANRCETLGLEYERAKADTFAALAEHRMGLRSAARARLTRSLEAFHAEGNSVWAGEALVGLATLWGRDDNPRAAAALFAAARRHFRRARDTEREACTLALASRAHLACGDRVGARRDLAAVRRLVGRRPSPRLQHLLFAAEAALARDAGDARAARRLLERAATESERLAARILDEHWRASFWGEWGWPHLELAVLELREGRIENALEALERGRGRALMGAATTARAHDRAALPREVRRWAGARFARERHRASRSTPTGSAAVPGAAEREGGKLVRALRQLPSHGIRAHALIEAMEPDQMLLDFFLHEGALGSFSIRRDGLTGAYPLAHETRVAELAHSVLFELRGAAYREPSQRTWDRGLDHALSELSSLVLWPALGGGFMLPRTLSLLPVGPLSRLPWGAMPLPDGSRLGERVSIVTIPGLRLGLIADQFSSTPQPAPPLVVGCPAEDLEHVMREAAAVAESFPGATVLAGGEATVEQFLRLAPSAAWIHFAGHGHYRPEAPCTSALRFSDRWMTADELLQLRLEARWVTLSACESARALVRPGEEWFGLARTFLLCGAGAVLAAQWDIEDATSAGLMGDLYARLAAGAPLVRALRDTQGDRLLRGSHPLDWAGFVLFGGLTAQRISAPEGILRAGASTLAS